MKTNRWDDHFARKAKEEKWLARSVYKLQEMDQRFSLIRQGDLVLDLGCNPGSWSQYCTGRVGHRGEVVGVDLTPPDHLFGANFRFVQADVLALDLNVLRAQVSPRNLILSDLAPRTTGSSTTDTSRSLALAQKAFEIALALLKAKGRFVCKVFEGEDVRAFRSVVSNRFETLKMFRPVAVRKRSREIYLIGITRVGEPGQGELDSNQVQQLQSS